MLYGSDPHDKGTQSMNRKEVIEILQNPTHPRQQDTARLVAQFLRTGVIGVCFGVHLDNTPGEARQAKVARTLEALVQGDAEAMAVVAGYIDDVGAPFSHLFPAFLKKLQESGEGPMPSSQT